MAETIDDKIKQPSKKGTGFTNIQRVLGANVGNRLGSTIGQGVQQQGQQARQNVQQSSQQFQQQSEANRIGTQQDQELVTNVLGSPTQVQNEQQNRFRQLMMGTYKGPKEIAESQKLMSQSQQAQFLGEAAGTQGGRIELLKRFAAPDQAQYTLGKQQMDNLLLGQQEAQLQAARRATQNLTGLTDTKLAAARGLYGLLTADAQRVGEETQGKFGQTVTDFYTQLENDRIAAEKARQERIKQIQSQYASGGMTQADIDRFNLQGLKGQYLYNLNLGGYLKQAEDQATLQNVASEEQIARLNALKNIAGTTVQGEQQAKLGLFEGLKPEEIQSYQKAAGYDFDAQRFQRDIAQAKAHAERAYYDVPGVSDVFWEANDAIGRYIPDATERDNVVRAAMGGDLGPASRYGASAMQAAKNVADTRPILEAEYNRRRGNILFNVIPNPTGNV